MKKTKDPLVKRLDGALKKFGGFLQSSLILNRFPEFKGTGPSTLFRWANKPPKRLSSRARVERAIEFLSGENNPKFGAKDVSKKERQLAIYFEILLLQRQIEQRFRTLFRLAGVSKKQQTRRLKEYAKQTNP